MAAARIKLGMQSKIYLGNLEAIRDWGYAPEYVESMWMMLQQDAPDDFVVATGEGASVRQFCQAAFEYLGLNYLDYLVTDSKYLRPTEVNSLIGDASKIEEKLSWKAETHWKAIAEIMVQSDYERIKES